MDNSSSIHNHRYLHPNSLVASNQAQAANQPASQGIALSFVEMDHALTEWLRDAGNDNVQAYESAKEQILACFKATQNNPSSPAAKHLNLNGLDLKTLPACIGELTALTEFECNANQLTTLPESIIKLKNLTILDCGSNRLTALPKSIGDLTELTNLSCDYNHLSALPKSIGKLKQLKKLDCGDNKLFTLPKSIGKLKRLTHLSCSNNQLIRLPKSIGYLTSLRALDCENNQLTCLPKSIGNLKSLAILDCFLNRLSELPSSLAQLPSTCCIDLTHNNHTWSWAVIEEMNTAIANARTTNPSQGPEIDYFAMPTKNSPECNLINEIDSWYHDSGNGWDDAQADLWINAIFSNPSLAPQDPDAVSHNLVALHDWMENMRRTSHYTHASSEVNERMHTLLEKLKNKPDALTVCAAQALEETGTCHDGVALKLIFMEELVLIQEALDLSVKPNANIDQLRQIALGLYKSNELRTIADEKVAQIVREHQEGIDPAEITLKYWTKLSKPLNLPFPLQHMIFAGLACQVSEEDIAIAQQTILEKEASALKESHDFKAYLANWGPWQSMLKTQFPQAHTQAMRDVDTFVEQAYTELEHMNLELEQLAVSQGTNSTEYLNLSARIGDLPNRIREFKTNRFIQLHNYMRSKTP